MVDTTPDIKDLTGAELLSDLPDLFNLGMAASAAFSTGPPPTTAVGWITKLGFTAGGFIGTVAAAFDKLHSGPVTIDDIATLLGLTPGGLMAMTEALAVKVIAQAND